MELVEILQHRAEVESRRRIVGAALESAPITLLRIGKLPILVQQAA